MLQLKGYMLAIEDIIRKLTDLWWQSYSVETFANFRDVFGDEFLGASFFDVDAKVVESFAGQSDNLEFKGLSNS